MRINRLRGNVADRPIDTTVVQGDDAPRSAMDRIVLMHPQTEQVEVSRRPTYTKG